MEKLEEMAIIAEQSDILEFIAKLLEKADEPLEKDQMVAISLIIKRCVEEIGKIA